MNIWKSACKHFQMQDDKKATASCATLSSGKGGTKTWEGILGSHASSGGVWNRLSLRLEFWERSHSYKNPTLTTFYHYQNRCQWSFTYDYAAFKIKIKRPVSFFETYFLQSSKSSVEIHLWIDGVKQCWYLIIPLFTLSHWNAFFTLTFLKRTRLYLKLMFGNI